MPEKIGNYFGAQVDKVWEGAWSFGVCLTHDPEETYMFINLIKWTVRIGWLSKYKD